MCSPTVPNAKPMENTEKNFFTKLLKSLFPKKKEKPKNKKQLQTQNEEKENQETTTQKDVLAAILKNFDKLDIKDNQETQNKEINEEQGQETHNEEQDERENFETYKVIEEARNERIHSHSSDSGYSEKSENSDDKPESVDKIDELTDELKCLKVFTDEKTREKKLQTALIRRGPIKTNSLKDVPRNYPYLRTEIDPCRQINEVNKNTLTGGKVIVNNQTLPDLYEISKPLETALQESQSQYPQENRDGYFNDAIDYINNDTLNQNLDIDIQSEYAPSSSPVMEEKDMTAMYDERAMLEHCMQLLEDKYMQTDELFQLLNENDCLVPSTEVANDTNIPYNADILPNISIPGETVDYILTQVPIQNNPLSHAAVYTYPTPPRSDCVLSPASATSASFYHTHSEYTLSPERSPGYNSDHEVYQQIQHFEEDKETTDRRNSTSSMTMKKFKDMQKDLSNIFSKEECCQTHRKSCKELFQEYMNKLDMSVRKDMCMKVAKLVVKDAYGLLHQTLISLSRSMELEAWNISFFGLLCHRLLAENIQIFTGETGLHLLKSAALRCPHLPLLTRHLVQCTRAALKSNPELALSKDYVFHEVDTLGDTPIIACVRAGDVCADVLAELVVTPPGLQPLFKLHHYNADGYTALHVACSQHSATKSRLHLIHVLLEHANFDLREGDSKGKDTALHLAVNSVNCDLQLVLFLFKQVDRKEWKNLAHLRNLSNKTPLDLARAATKSTSRQSYPPEVLDFLKKCR